MSICSLKIIETSPSFREAARGMRSRALTAELDIPIFMQRCDSGPLNARGAPSGISTIHAAVVEGGKYKTPGDIEAFLRKQEMPYAKTTTREGIPEFEIKYLN